MQQNIIHDQHKDNVTATITRIKNDIYNNWNTNRDYAFTLYEELIKLNKTDNQKKQNTRINNEYIEKLVEESLDNGELYPELLEDETAINAVVYLKERVDAYRWQNNQKSIKYAKMIIQLGESRADINQKALGFMAMGDSIAISGKQLKEAWELQQQGAELFMQDGDILGWARTIIGRVGICIELERVDETLKEAETALEFFKYYNYKDFFVRLSINMMRICNETGQFNHTLALFNDAYQAALSLKENKEQHLLILYNNSGVAYWQKGEFNHAFDSLIKAKNIAAKLKKTESVIFILTNIAYIEYMRGNYNEALSLSNKMLSEFKTNNTLFLLRIKRNMADCYINLNRDQEAIDLLQSIISGLSVPEEINHIDLAYAYHLLGTAEAKAGQFEKSEYSFKKAKEYFLSFHSDTWSWYTDIVRGKVLLMKGDIKKALQLANDSAAYFQKTNQQANLARAYLLKAECFTKTGEYEKARAIGQKLLNTGKQCHIFSLFYNTHMIMGKIEEARGNITNSMKYYNEAVEIIENLQQNLSITIRPEFFEDKCEGIHALIRQLLKIDEYVKSYETIERLKSMTIMGYLINRKRLYWSEEDKESRELIRELKQQRNDYRCLYTLYNERPLRQDDDPALEANLLEEKIRIYENKIRSIIEKLYLLNAKKNRYIPVNKPGIASIQSHLPDASILIEYYSNGKNVWAFVLEQKNLSVYKLTSTITNIEELLDKYYDNINFALQEGNGSTDMPHLVRLARRLGSHLYDTLIKPFEHHLKSNKQLLIVPFGLLHYVPFNILYNNGSYLIEHIDISILPSAGLITRKNISKKHGMVILAHMNKGDLINTVAEAEEISAIMPSFVFCNETATQNRLDSASKQILHIAAHGKHRIDQPDLSYIQLDDGYLYADDLLQKDLEYELVTLSACETGKTIVKQSEEMIGLVRGVLFAGAQSIVVSMWRIDDMMTVQLMKHFYKLLKSGKSKAASLCTAQRNLIKKNNDLHPAFWGAFQLIGHTGPLSGCSE